jgi:hypothetical protein
MKFTCPSYAAIARTLKQATARHKPQVIENKAPEWKTLAEHEADTAAAVRRIFRTADFNPGTGLIRVPADAATVRLLVPALAHCRLVSGNNAHCWFECSPAN